MSTFSIIILILWIANGLHCVILANINKSILVDIGKRKRVFGISTISDFTDLYKAVKSDEALSKYKKFIYHYIIANILEIMLTIIFIVSMV